MQQDDFKGYIALLQKPYNLPRKTCVYVLPFQITFVGYKYT